MHPSKTHDISLAELGRLRSFAALPEEARAKLLAEGDVCVLAPRQEWKPPAEDVGKTTCFLLRGELAVGWPKDDPGPAELPQKGPFADGLELVSYLEEGDVFSDAFLEGLPGDRGQTRLRLVATVRAALLCLPSMALAALFQRHPEWKRDLLRGSSFVWYHCLGQLRSEGRSIQDFYLRHGMSFATTLKVVELSRCLECDACENACKGRHGTARFARKGQSLGRLGFAVSCRTCLDRRCVEVCKKNAIAYEADCGEVRIFPSCIGCGACARICPNQAIFMVPLPSQLDLFAAPDGAAQEDRPKKAKAPKKVAIKCDHCVGHADLACLRVCPTRAIQELAPEEIFIRRGCEPGRGREPFSGLPFYEGIDESRARRAGQRRLPWGACATAVCLLVLGLEAFLERTMPAASIRQLFSPVALRDGPELFASGQGIGHGLGYAGAIIMLLTFLYPLQSRLHWFEGWITRSHWLSAHLWVGFAGATLTTYHTLLKLDRWAGTAAVFMWLTVLSGVIGRYLYGRIHSGIALAESELRTLEGATLFRDVQLDALLPPPGEPAFGLVSMILQDLRERARLFWLRLFGLRHVSDPVARRQLWRLLSGYSGNRRILLYLERTRRWLLHWNKAHLALSLAMAIVSALHVAYSLMYKPV